MSSKLLMRNQDIVTYESEEETKELTCLLGELRQLNELQKDLGHLLVEQGENIETINTSVENTVELTVDANTQLEKASGQKIKIMPFAIGAGVGLALGGAVGIPLMVSGFISSTVLGYSAIGTTLLGGISGRSLA
jgi:predicted phage tail protein